MGISLQMLLPSFVNSVMPWTLVTLRVPYTPRYMLQQLAQNCSWNGSTGELEFHKFTLNYHKALLTLWFANCFVLIGAPNNKWLGWMQRLAYSIKTNDHDQERNVIMNNTDLWMGILSDDTSILFNISFVFHGIS